MSIGEKDDGSDVIMAGIADLPDNSQCIFISSHTFGDYSAIFLKQNRLQVLSDGPLASEEVKKFAQLIISRMEFA
jgi:hypothetical protein